jgi:hypothetical protein
MNHINNFVELLGKINQLLSESGEESWEKSFRGFLKRSDDAKDHQNLLSDIFQIYGGMGSFSDLVLYSNNKVLISENNLLDELRQNLFDVVLELKTTPRNKWLSFVRK